MMTPPPHGQTDGTPAVGAKRRIDLIDALRGIACVGVLLHHSFSSKAVPEGALHYPFMVIARMADFGWLGVSLFLVLSGFCLFYPLATRYNLTEIRLNLAQFAKRRAMRILPPYYIALFIL